VVKCFWGCRYGLILMSLICLWLPVSVCAAEDKAIVADAARTPQPQKSDTAVPARNNKLGSASFPVPVVRDLVGLIGVNEIPVSADADGVFAQTMAKYQVLEDESAAQAESTDLGSSIASGRQFNRDSRIARARVDQASAQSGQALSDLLPNVSIRANRGYEISEPSVVVDPFTGELLPYSRHIRTDVSFTATQPLFNLPTFLEWRRASKRLDAREEDFRVKDGDAYVDIVSTYLKLVSSRLQADVTRDFEQQLEQLMNYIEKRAAAGAASVSDMSRVQARRQGTLSTRLQQESSHLAAGTEFVQLTNLVPQMVQLPHLADVDGNRLPQSYEEAVSLAMTSNPELASLEADLAAEKIGLASAKTRFLPRFDAEYTDTYSDHAGGGSETQRDRRMMLVANWNLFSGGRDLNYHAERTARCQELRYRLDKERRRVVQALASNYAALETARARINSGYKELESIATAATAMSTRMLSGNQSLLDLLDVYDRYYQVRSRLVELHVLEMNTATQLVRLTYGTPWDDSTPPEITAPSVNDAPEITSTVNATSDTAPTDESSSQAELSYDRQRRLGITKNPWVSR